MWALPAEVLESRDHRRFLEAASLELTDPERFLARIAEIDATAPPQTSDVLELADGRVFERVSRIQFIDGQDVGRVWSFRDVTERRRADEARTRLAAVVETSDDGIVSKTLDGIVRTWNQGAERIFGYSAEEMVGQPIQVLLPVDRVDEETEILSRLQRGERVDHFETLRVRKDGRVIDVSVTISPIRDSTGRIVGASKIARDITERRRAEQSVRFLADASAALAELNDYESTLQRVATLSVPAFADGCFVDMRAPDGSMRRLAISHTDDAQAAHLRELWDRFPPRPTDTHGVMRVMRTGEPDWAPAVDDDMLRRIAHDDDHLRELRELGIRSYLCVPLRSRAAAIGALTFITAKSGRNYRRDDLRAAEDLAHRAVIAIENANLLAALKQSDQRKDEFLAVLAHELRNPLAPIRHAARLLGIRNADPAQMQLARDIIGRQVARMALLLDDLLDVSRITRGRLELRREHVQVAALVKSAVETSKPVIDAKHHHFSVQLPDEPLELDVDPLRISQALSNLLTNAAKYTDSGGEIALQVRHADGQTEFSVRDSGIGLSQDALSSVFEMFSQMESAIDRSEGGLGIGLSLVKGLVSLHGGTVEAASDGPGLGSTFTMRLPGGRVALDAGENDAPAQRKSFSGAGGRILVVDDNLDAATTLAMVLRNCGHEVFTAGSGPQGLAMGEQLHPNVVILDIGMPDMNGYEVATRMRQTGWGDETLLLALTGWGHKDDVARAQAAGFDGHMTKPVDPDRVEAAIEEFLKTRRRPGIALEHT
jgi:PAS domain S-box-containing protein